MTTMTVNICLLQIIAFFDLFAVGLIVPLITSHVRVLGAGHLYVGILGSTYPAFQLASGPLIGSLSDLKGRRDILIMTLLICGICYTLLGYIQSLYVILSIRAILGLFKQTQGLTRALVPDYEESEQAQSEIYGKIAAISGIGMILGPVVSGHLAEDFPKQALAIVATIVGVCFAINAVLVYILPNTKSDVKQKKKESKLKQDVSTSVMRRLLNACTESVQELYEIDWSKYGTIFLFKGLIEFAMFLQFANYAFYLKTTYGLTFKSIGYIISFKGVIRSISSYFIGFINSYYTEDKYYSIRNFHIFLVTSMSLLGIIYSFNIYVYAIFMIPLGISEAVSRLVSLEMLLKNDRGIHRATLIGAANSVRSLAGVIAPIVSGIIGQYFGVPYVVYAAFFVSSLGCYVSYRHKTKLLKIVKKD